MSDSCSLRSDDAVLFAARRQAMIREWNDTAVLHPKAAAGIHELFAKQAALTPKATAAITQGGRWSYSEIDRRTNQWACYLRRLGVAAESRVGVALENSPRQLLAVLGTLKAGAAFVPLDPTYPRRRLASMIEDARLELLLTASEFAASMDFGVRTIEVDTEWAKVADVPLTALPAATGGEYSACVLYTFDPTGEPEGVIVPHRAIVNFLLWLQTVSPLFGDDRVLRTAAIGSDVSLWEPFWPLVSGARLVDLPPEAPPNGGLLIEAIRDHGVTAAHFGPSLLRSLTAEEALTEIDSLRLALIRGDDLRLDDIQLLSARTRTRLRYLYGPIETVAGAMSRQLEGSSAEKATHIQQLGRAIANVRFYVLDSGNRPQPVGDQGHLHVGGIGLARGYLGQAAKTADRFVPDPFASEPGARLFQTRQKARWRRDGTAEICGSLVDQVNLDGFQVQLGEIVALLQREVGVPAIALTNENRLTVYCGSAQELQTTTPELMSLLQSRLPRHMIPAKITELGRIGQSFLGGAFSGRSPAHLDDPSWSSLQALLEEQEPFEGTSPKPAADYSISSRSAPPPKGNHSPGANRGGELGRPPTETLDPRTSADARFFFVLQGDRVAARWIEAGSDFELVFDYRPPPPDALATVAGQRLEKARLKDAHLTLTLLPPPEVLVRDGRWFLPVKFENGRLAETVRFQLRAASPPPAGEQVVLHLTFAEHGSVFYHFVVKARIVTSLELRPRPVAISPPPHIDLEAEITQAQEARTGREATLYFYSEGDTIRAQLEAGDYRPPPRSLDITKPVLEKSLSRVAVEVGKVIQEKDRQGLWEAMAEPLDPPPNDRQKTLLVEAMERMATLGHNLFTLLRKDESLRPLLDRLDQLEDSSRVTIMTNMLFIPWELLNSAPYDNAWPESHKQKNPLQPHRFWGYRFKIETILFSDGHHSYLPAETGEPFLRCYINPTIDQKTSKTYGESHREIIENSHHLWLSQSQEMKESLFEIDTTTTLMYFFCHGSSETLELDQTFVIDAFFLAPQDSRRWERRPLVVLNACSAGAYSPLAFLNFLESFMTLGACGLVTATFPIPTSFGAAFGRELLAGYLRKEPIGEVVHSARRRAVEAGNPVGLFYTLQCKLEVCAPGARRSLAA